MKGIYRNGVLQIRCPLCHDFMVYQWESVRGIFVFSCRRDRVAIAADDPMLGRWEEVQHKMGEEGKIPCPACDADMRFFSTSVGFIKTRCPKKECGVTMASGTAPEDKAYFKNALPPASISPKLLH